MLQRSRRPLVIAAATSAIVLSGALSTAAGAAEGPTPTVRESAPSAQPRALDLGAILGSVLSGDVDAALSGLSFEEVLADPAQLTTLLSGLTGGDLATLVLGLTGGDLTNVVGALTPAQITELIASPTGTGSVITGLLGTVTQLAGGGAANPDAVNLLLGQVTALVAGGLPTDPAQLADLTSLLALLKPLLSTAGVDPDLVAGLLGTLGGALGLFPADGTGDPSTGPGGAATPPSSTAPAARDFQLPTCPVKNTSKLSLARASTAGGKLNVLAPITARASGQMDVEYHAAGTRTRFKAPVDSSNRRVRFARDVPDAQARLGTGILTMKYAGNSDTRLQEVRLRAARNKAKLDLKRPTISLVGNELRVKASGTVNSKARGVVRLQLEYQFLCDTRVLELKGEINNGRWSIDEKLPDKQAIEMILRSGSVHSYTLFTGYLPQRIRGEMRSFQVLPFQSLEQLLAR